MKPDSTLVQKKCSGTEIGISLIKAAAIMDFCDENDIPMRAATLYGTVRRRYGSSRRISKPQATGSNPRSWMHVWTAI